MLFVIFMTVFKVDAQGTRESVTCFLLQFIEKLVWTQISVRFSQSLTEYYNVPVDDELLHTIKKCQQLFS